MLNQAKGQLQANGFTHLGPVIESHTAESLFQAFQDHLGPKPEVNDYGLLRNDIWRKVSLFQQRILNGQLGKLAADLLNVDEVILFQDNVIQKPPYHSQEVAWHQDYAYWPLDQPLGLTFWIALTRVTEQNGCLHYWPGSHREGEYQATDFMLGTNQPKPGNLPILECQTRTSIACPIDAGEALVHHPLAWHMSQGNSTDKARCGWSITFLHPTVRWNPSHAPHPWNHRLSPKPGSPLSPSRFPRMLRSHSSNNAHTFS